MKFIAPIIILVSISFIIFLGYKKNIFSIPKNFGEKLLMFSLCITIFFCIGTLMNTRMVQEEIPIVQKDSIFIDNDNISLFLETIDGRVAQKNINYNSNFEYEIYKEETKQPFLEINKQQRMFLFTNVVENTNNERGWGNISKKDGEHISYILHIDEKTFKEINNKRKEIVKNESN